MRPIARAGAVSHGCTVSRTQWSRAAWVPVLLLAPVQLGLDRIAPDLAVSLARILELPQCVGMLGGGHSAAHYYVGTCGSDVLFLDPHTTQAAVDMSDDRFDMRVCAVLRDRACFVTRRRATRATTRCACQ